MIFTFERRAIITMLLLSSPIIAALIYSAVVPVEAGAVAFFNLMWSLIIFLLMRFVMKVEGIDFLTGLGLGMMISSLFAYHHVCIVLSAIGALFVILSLTIDIVRGRVVVIRPR